MTAHKASASHEETTRGSALLTNAVGLHARPSVKLTQLAKTYQAIVSVATEPTGPWIDAKSPVKIMRVKAPKGTTLYFEASGEDANKQCEQAAQSAAEQSSEPETDNDVSLPIGDHRKRNSEALHKQFHDKVAIDITGLIVHLKTGHFYGISHFTDHRWSEPASYRTDGGVLPGREGNLI